MDFGAIIKAPTQDPEWIKKCAIMGLILLIPIAGGLNMLGWLKATYARVKAGDPTLPDAGFNYIGSGWDMFLAILPPFLVLMVLGFVVGLAAAITHSSAIAGLGNLVVGLLELVIFVGVLPVLSYRHVVHNTGFGAALDVAENMKVATSNTGMFMTFAIIYFVADLIAGMGVVACCVGAFVTYPFGFAIHANAIKAFEDSNGGL